MRLLSLWAAVAIACSGSWSVGCSGNDETGTGGGTTSSQGGSKPAVGGGGATTTASGGTGGMGTGGIGLGGGGGADVPLDGFGSIMGECGVIEPNELDAGSPPFEVDNAIDFLRPFSTELLSEGGQTIFFDVNGGGSSKESEAIAFDVLYRCELATLLKTETEIVYDTMGKITDLLVEIDGQKVGVSVVRAFAFMADYTVQDALATMTDKLSDIQESSANVSSSDAWSKQILAVIAEKPENGVAVMTALPMIDAATRGDTIVIVTVTNGDDTFIY
jgi:hypothetical protein